jgi:hypothetical protein
MKGFFTMDAGVYETLFQFNQRLDRVLESLELLNQQSLAPTGYLDLVRVRLNETPTFANGQDTDQICRLEKAADDRDYGCLRRRGKTVGVRGGKLNGSPKPREGTVEKGIAYACCDSSLVRI